MNAWCVTKSQHEEARAHTHTDTVATSIIVCLHVPTGWKRPRMVRRAQRVLYALRELLRGQQVIYAFHARISRTIQRLTGNLMRFRFMVWLTSGTLRICQRRILNKHCVISGWVTVIEGSNLPVDFFSSKGSNYIQAKSIGRVCRHGSVVFLFLMGTCQFSHQIEISRKTQRSVNIVLSPLSFLPFMPGVENLREDGMMLKSGGWSGRYGA